jgi:hypothetical protein
MSREENKASAKVGAFSIGRLGAGDNSSLVISGRCRGCIAAFA